MSTKNLLMVLLVEKIVELPMFSFELPSWLWIVIAIFGVSIALYITYKLLPVIAFVLAILNDVLDYTGVTLLPIGGDVFDLITSLTIVIAFRRLLSFTSFLELLPIPTLEVLPIHTIAVILSAITPKKKLVHPQETKYWRLREVVRLTVCGVLARLF